MLRLFPLLTILITSTAAAAELKLEFIAASSVSLDNPHDLKLSPDGKYLFVSDVGNDRVAILDPVTLEFVAEFGAKDYACELANCHYGVYQMLGKLSAVVYSLASASDRAGEPA